ncbi:MAG TPA: hypothetical protein VGY98_05890 [Verrucomicrobiae bacterium]|nr:hypothetical protein [Verrucomicrobiae bacterium]
MKARKLIYFTLVLGGALACRGLRAETVTNSPAWTNSPALMNLARAGNFYGAEVFFNKKRGAFPPDERNAVFLLAAQSLSTTNAGTALEFMSSMLDDYIAVSNGITYQDHGITSKNAIPYLIENLKADVGFEETIEILRELTRRNGGFVNGNDFFFVKNPQAVVDWWKNWWRQDQERHPIFDADLEMLLRGEVLKLDDKIVQASVGVPDKTGYLRWDSGTRFVLEHDGRMYSGEEWKDPDSVFTFYYGHFPGGGFKSGGYFPQMGDDVLRIRGEYLTKDLFSTNEPPQGDIPGESFPMQEIFSETIQGTDIAIKVEIATKNKALITALKEGLNGQ